MNSTNNTVPQNNPNLPSNSSNGVLSENNQYTIQPKGTNSQKKLVFSLIAFFVVLLSLIIGLIASGALENDNSDSNDSIDQVVENREEDEDAEEEPSIVENIEEECSNPQKYTNAYFPKFVLNYDQCDWTVTESEELKKGDNNPFNLYVSLTHTDGTVVKVVLGVYGIVGFAGIADCGTEQVYAVNSKIAGILTAPNIYSYKDNTYLRGTAEFDSLLAEAAAFPEFAPPSGSSSTYCSEIGPSFTTETTMTAGEAEITDLINNPDQVLSVFMSVEATMLADTNENRTLVADLVKLIEY